MRYCGNSIWLDERTWQQDSLKTMSLPALSAGKAMKTCSTTPTDWLGGTSLKWPILCRVRRKTLTQSSIKTRSNHPQGSECVIYHKLHKLVDTCQNYSKPTLALFVESRLSYEWPRVHSTRLSYYTVDDEWVRGNLSTNRRNLFWSSPYVLLHYWLMTIRASGLWQAASCVPYRVLTTLENLENSGIFLILENLLKFEMYSGNFWKSDGMFRWCNLKPMHNKS